MEESVLLVTKPLVDFIRRFIQDPSGVFSVFHLCECRIVQWRHDSRLLLLLNWSPYNKKNITRWLEDMNFMFEWQEQYLTSERSERVRYCSCQSNIKFISSRHRVISSIYFSWKVSNSNTLCHWKTFQKLSIAIAKPILIPQKCVKHSRSQPVSVKAK